MVGQPFALQSGDLRELCTCDVADCCMPSSMALGVADSPSRCTQSNTAGTPRAAPFCCAHRHPECDCRAASALAPRETDDSAGMRSSARASCPRDEGNCGLHAGPWSAMFAPRRGAPVSFTTAPDRLPAPPVLAAPALMILQEKHVDSGVHGRIWEN
jgi:hypothetical protein